MDSCSLWTIRNKEADRLTKDGSSKPQLPAKISFQEMKTLLKIPPTKHGKIESTLRFSKTIYTTFLKTFGQLYFDWQHATAALMHTCTGKNWQRTLLRLRTQPTDSRTCTDELPTHWAVKEEHMAYRDATGGETMANKGGTPLHSFLHRRDLYQSLGFGHEENDRWRRRRRTRG